jgi:hypothetical protein
VRREESLSGSMETGAENGVATDYEDSNDEEVYIEENEEEV